MANLLSHLFTTAEYIFAIVTLLGGVIAIHEFGHFIFAKWCGIRVDTFSIGFGPKLFSRKYGETEYCLSLIPLGGFVKIYGQDPEELTSDPSPQPERAFVKKSLPQKLSVLFGGPLLNYVLAIFIFSFLAMAGMLKLPAMATRVVKDTPAYQAGLRSGDKIVAIDGIPMKTFDDVADEIAKHPEKVIRFSIIREKEAKELDIKVQKEHALTPYGEESIAGVLEGLDPLAREAIIATTLKDHPWGVKTGDKIIEANGLAIASWEDLEKVFETILPKADSIALKVKRGSETIPLQVNNIRAQAKKAAGKGANELFDTVGIYNPELFIQDVLKGSPADLAGLKNGDRLVSANKQKLYSFDNLRTIVQTTGENLAKGASKQEGDLKDALSLEIEREGKLTPLVSGIRPAKGKDPLGQPIVTYTIGILSGGKPMMPPNMIMERTLNPFKAVGIGFSETWNNTAMTVIGLKKIAFGEVSAKSMGGPIMIGKLAGDTFSSRGWRDFIRIMAIISISLGVFNLLPVPILDGGHIVFAIIESIRGRPLSQTVQQTFLKVGLSLILILMVFALYNDISRVLPMPF